MRESSWAALADAEASKPYWASLETFVQREWIGATVYPPREHVFRALNSVPLGDVRVVIVGQVRFHCPFAPDGV